MKNVVADATARNAIVVAKKRAIVKIVIVKTNARTAVAVAGMNHNESYNKIKLCTYICPFECPESSSYLSPMESFECLERII